MYILTSIVFHHFRRVKTGCQPFHTVDSWFFQTVALGIKLSRNKFHIQIYRILTTCITIHCVYFLKHLIYFFCRYILLRIIFICIDDMEYDRKFIFQFLPFS